MNKKLQFFLLLLFLSLSIMPANNVFAKINDNTPSTAINLPLNTLMNGSLTVSEFYNATITVPGIYLINVTGISGGNYWVSVNDSLGNTIGYATANANPQILYVNLNLGVYTIIVYSPYSPGQFTILMTQSSYPAGYELSNAINLPLNTPLEQSLPANRYFNFTVTTTGEYTASLIANSSTNFNLNLYNSQGSEINTSYTSTYPKTIDTILSPGSYYINVFSNSGSGSFTLEVYNTANNGQSLSTAIQLPLNTVLANSTNYYQVWYNVTITNSGQYKAIMSYSQYSYMYFTVYNANGYYISSSYSVGNSGEDILNLTPGIYSISVYNNYGGGYTIQMINYPTLQPGETQSNAINLPLNTNVTYNYPYSFWFNFSIQTSGSYKVYVTSYNSSEPVSFSLYDQNLFYLGGSFYYGPTSNQLAVTLTSGFYYVNVYSSYINNPFSIDVAPYTIQPGETIHNALLLPFNQSVTGNFPHDFYYNTTVPYNGTFRLDLTGISGNLYYPLGFSVDYSNGTNIGYSKYLSYLQDLVVNMTTGETYTVSIYGYATCSISLKIIPYISYPGEDLAHAIDLRLNSTYNGSLPFNNYFNFTIPVTGTYYFTLKSNFGLNLGVGVTDQYGNYLPLNYLKSNPLQISVSLTPGNYTFSFSIGMPITNPNFSLFFTNYRPNLSTSNPVSSSTTTTSQSTSSKSTITLSTPFSPLEVIILSIVSLAVISLKRRKI